MFLQDLLTSSFNFSMLSDGCILEVSRLVISTVGAERMTYSYWSSSGASLIAFSVTSLTLLSGHLALLSKAELYAFFDVNLDLVFDSICLAATFCAIESPTYNIRGFERKKFFFFIIGGEVLDVADGAGGTDGADGAGGADGADGADGVGLVVVGDDTEHFGSERTGSDVVLCI